MWYLMSYPGGMMCCLGFIVLPRARVARFARGPTVKITNASPKLWKKQCREESSGHDNFHRDMIV